MIHIMSYKYLFHLSCHVYNSKLCCRKDCEDSDPERLQEIVKNIHRCLENFKFGEEGVAKQAETVILYLQNGLSEKVSEAHE